MILVSILLQIIRQVSCGSDHVVALSECGLLQAWGKLHLKFITCNCLNKIFLVKLNCNSAVICSRKHISADAVYVYSILIMDRSYDLGKET